MGRPTGICASDTREEIQEGDTVRLGVVCCEGTGYYAGDGPQHWEEHTGVVTLNSPDEKTRPTDWVIVTADGRKYCLVSYSLRRIVVKEQP